MKAGVSHLLMLTQAAKFGQADIYSFLVAVVDSVAQSNERTRMYDNKECIQHAREEARRV